MAQIELNTETGLFEAVIEGEENVQEGQEDVQPDVLENTEDILDFVEPSSMEDSPETPFGSESYLYDDTISLMSAIPSSAAFTPNAWQVNLASNRSMGEHYLMYDFDYVGVDPARSSSVYVIYALLALIVVLLMIRGKR